MIMLLIAIAAVEAIITVLLIRQSSRIGLVARLHVTLQFELSSGQWDDALADLDQLERLPGGSWPAFSAMVRATIQAGLDRRVQPVYDPMRGKRWDEESQSYVPDIDPA